MYGMNTDIFFGFREHIDRRIWRAGSYGRRRDRNRRREGKASTKHRYFAGAKLLFAIVLLGQYERQL